MTVPPGQTQLPGMRNTKRIARYATDTMAAGKPLPVVGCIPSHLICVTPLL